MEKEFVPYELALRLKALGFNEPCFGTWRRNLFEYNIDFHTKVQLDHNLCPKNSEYVNDWISSPTFSQAFKWFRDEYNLHCGINTHTSSTNQITYVIDFEFGKKLTYEEAELAALKRLIEIVEVKGK